MFHLFEISGLYFFLSIRKTIPEKFYSENHSLLGITKVPGAGS